MTRWVHLQFLKHEHLGVPRALIVTLSFVSRFVPNALERSSVCCFSLGQDKLEFGHQLYQQLLRGRLATRAPDARAPDGGAAAARSDGGAARGAGGGAESGTLGAFSWTDLTALIHEQVSLLISSVNRAEQKASVINFPDVSFQRSCQMFLV